MRKMELRDPVARATVLIYEAESLLGSYAASAPDREDSVVASVASGQLEDIWVHPGRGRQKPESRS